MDGRQQDSTRPFSAVYVCVCVCTVGGVPSSSVSSCETTLSMTPPESAPRPRAGARESNSSKNTTHGAISRACMRQTEANSDRPVCLSVLPSLSLCLSGQCVWVPSMTYLFEYLSHVALALTDVPDEGSRRRKASYQLAIAMH